MSLDSIDGVSTKTAKRPLLLTAAIALACAAAFLLQAGPVRSANPTTGSDVVIDATSFRCIRKMTPVRHFYVDNLLGDLDATLAAANSATGAVYPPGSVVQLVPGEAMVKRARGFNAATHDWEFFELDVSKDGTQIRKRGFVDVVNRFGGNCFGCHAAARPEWDLVCEDSHGCAPIPLTRAMSGALQRTDPRCENAPLSAVDAEALERLKELSKPKEASEPR
ncbi:MAG TPA: hypothetical protein VMS55_25570 [Myxococcota bacterium]|nr:hypothetical protein [Myxococcota bacterium]